ncbi:hypothetical protein FISHEDRAFT_35486, partial [Fistulina hepatica ATCC 64428]
MHSQQQLTNGAGTIQMSSQTPYGPHVATATSSVAVPPGIGQSSQASQGQEDISTVFVVGFPDDMQEREFQNMFTFSSGFEAATLKVPNKEYTAYGSTLSAGSSNSTQQRYHSGFPDSYSDANGAWPAGSDETNTTSGSSGPGNSHYGGTQMPPRKQIIGFAKFRTRAEAMAARDALQGRRVDIEKGAVLKAEMAKKNLHTKRGVGIVPVPTTHNATS